MKLPSKYFLLKTVLCILLFMGVLMYTFPVQVMFLLGIDDTLFRHGIDGKLFMLALSFLISGVVLLELRQGVTSSAPSGKLAIFSSLPAIFGGILLLKSYLDLVVISQNRLITTLEELHMRIMYLFVSAMLIALSWAVQAMNCTKLLKGFSAIYFIYGGVMMVIVDIVSILQTATEEFFAYSLTIIYPPLIWGTLFAGITFLLLHLPVKIKQRKEFVNA